ncbi:hypothetical protein BH09BAC4_BH09BAC4_14720 [soil metagenome]
MIPMKTAFYSTDCSVDSALALRSWLATNADGAIHLTVVHAYDIEAGTALTKEAFRAAKQQAKARLDHWLEMLYQSWTGEVKPETLLASPELAITMHLLLRSYDILLLDEQIIAETILNQTKTNCCRIRNYGMSVQNL